MKTAAMMLLAGMVCAAGADTTNRPPTTVQQKIDYARQLRDAQCLGAAFDELADAIEQMHEAMTNAPAVKQPDPYRWWEHIQPLTNAPGLEWYYRNISNSTFQCLQQVDCIPAASPRPDEGE